MRVIHVAKDNAIELSWMWLPTFIGQNYGVLKELGKAWEDEFPKGVAITPESLDAMHEFTIDWLCKKFYIAGLYKYLKAIENVEESGDVV
jgi:hypothetical protein